MSESTDWTLIVRASQQAKVAAEAAVASAKLLESEAGHRLTAMEARLGAIEGRIANLAAGQNSHELAIMRIADTQADHTARSTSRLRCCSPTSRGSWAHEEATSAAG